jgi:hypothetical protein
MRRSFLILAALSISAWSQQPAQQPQRPPQQSQQTAPALAQLPPVIKVEMPPTSAPNPWVHIADLLIPGIVGASLAFFGVSLTNRHNRKLNEKNRSFEVERKKYAGAGSHRS